MSRSKQADHRLVQPRPEHYIKDENGQNILVGPYSLEQRNQYFDIQISLHQTRNKDAAPAAARSAAFQKWRNLVFATIGDEYIPATRDGKDKVQLLKDRPHA